LHPQKETTFMKITKYNKTYDTSDGTEQHREDPDAVEAKRVRREDEADRKRWQDDGAPGTLSVEANPTPTVAKPAWSVLSLREMRLALAAWLRGADDRERQESGQTKSADARTAAAGKAAADKVYRDRYRNAWENT
jgi:hypothetical protein